MPFDGEDSETFEGVERQERSALLDDVPLLASTNIDVILKERTPCVPSDDSRKLAAQSQLFGKSL